MSQKKIHMNAMVAGGVEDPLLSKNKCSELQKQLHDQFTQDALGFRNNPELKKKMFEAMDAQEEWDNLYYASIKKMKDNNKKKEE